MEKQQRMCFVISPIGEKDSPTRRYYDELRELIIEPAFETLDNFRVIRGDDLVAEERIDESVIKCIREAPICICDISEPNLNVYYELGRREETGKPVMLLARKGIELPTDFRSRRYCEYDLYNTHSVRETILAIRTFVRERINEKAEPASIRSTGVISENQFDQLRYELRQELSDYLENLSFTIQESSGQHAFSEGAAEGEFTQNRQTLHIIRIR